FHWRRPMIGKMTAAAAALALGMTGVAEAASPDVVRVESGQLKGVAADGVMAFKGVPYAAPPVGPLRWRAPQPAAKWTGVRPAVEYGHDCAQKPFIYDSAPLRTTPSEDCLVLNVWRPAEAASSAKL